MEQYSGPTTTAHSEADQRMKADVTGQKKSILKRLLKKKNNWK